MEWSRKNACLSLVVLLSLAVVGLAWLHFWTKSRMAAQWTISGGSAAFGRRYRVLCVGDSLTAGYHWRGQQFNPYGVTLQRLLDESNVSQNCSFSIEWLGYNGWTTKEILESADMRHVFDHVRKPWTGLAVKLSHYQFDLAVVMAGTNDLGRRKSAEVRELS
jgi:hypothetical protein